MRFDPLFHWAPTERRRSILQAGLIPYARPVTHSAGEDDNRLSFPYICLGPNPSMAWSYSAASREGLEDEYEGWDLWQVRLAESVDVYVLPFWGSHVQEIRARSAIGADCVWYVATRHGLSAEPQDADGPAPVACARCRGRGLAAGLPCVDCKGHGHVL